MQQDAERGDNISNTNIDRPRRPVVSRNRRRRYLELHPEYFRDASREISDPLLYDRLVRRFMSAEERQQQGRDRGFSNAFEASIVRSEAKLHAVNHPDPEKPLVYVRQGDGSVQGVERDEEDRAHDKADGWALWTEHIRERFVQGRDEDFDYTSVDDDEAYDDRGEEDRNELEHYLHGESEEFVGDGPLQGETGVQDF